MTTETVAETTTHMHDLGITVSVGELDHNQIAAMRTILEREVTALVNRVNAETAFLTGAEVGWFVSYDGSRECDR